MSAFVERVLTGPGAAKFLPAFLPLQQKVARCGIVNSLAQVVLKIASPGVPDFYQGCELWDFNLVDPDNRRPVDFIRREQMLDAVDRRARYARRSAARALGQLLKTSRSGAVKLLVTAAGLRLRTEMTDVFLDGEYLPLDVEMTRGRTCDRVRTVARRRPRRDRDRAAPRQRLVSAERPIPLGDAWRTSRVLLPKSLGSLTFTRRLHGGRDPARGDG